MTNIEEKMKKEKNQVKEEIKLEEEIGGRGGLEPTRYGVETPEWEKKGRVSDF
jgi:hypothetical protein